LHFSSFPPRPVRSTLLPYTTLFRSFRPSEGRYKIYIIDEVHMLSGSAFNALLKTLEEPPPFARFILATTEPHKIPATVLSRCQRDRKSTRLNSSHVKISYAVFCLKK